MNTIHHGIILKSYIPFKQKICLLDEDLGRIEATPRIKYKHTPLCHGAYITYSVDTLRFCYAVNDIDVIDIPEYWMRTNMLFMHHVLELCYYFLPLESKAGDIFILIRMLYADQEIMQTDIAQKIFLCHFFNRLGIWPDNYHVYGDAFFRLISGPIDSKVNAEDVPILRDALRTWLLGCIAVHPHAYRLKTVHFLTSLGIHE